MVYRCKIMSILLLATFLTGCGTTSTSTSSIDDVEYGDEHYYKSVSDRVSLVEDDERNINEDFSNGLDDSQWYALEGAWHTTEAAAPHNGMKHRNLFYSTDDNNEKYLVIRGRGYYNRDEDFEYNKPEGGCIVTKQHLGPGRYEIEMAAMPREGGVTAMWTYCTTTGSEITSQNEIDIEIGGSTDGTQFENFWATSWTKQQTKDTDTINVTDLLYLNDGKIHKYTFDWYTDYLGTGEKRVDWYVDEIFIGSMSGNVVSEHEMPLWVGVWFPPLWAGQPAFEEDYMIIKSIKYTAFDSTQWYETCRSNPGYTKVDPSSLNIQNIAWSKVKNVNKLANGSFDTMDVAPRDESYYGWVRETASTGTTFLTAGQNDNAFSLTAGPDGTTYHGEYLGQTISNTFPGYRFKLTATAKLLNSASEGNIEIRFYDKAGSSISPQNIAINQTNWQAVEQELVVPQGAVKTKISITAEEGTVIYDEISLTYLGN